MDGWATLIVLGRPREAKLPGAQRSKEAKGSHNKNTRPQKIISMYGVPPDNKEEALFFLTRLQALGAMS